MLAVVTGASGHLGANLIRALLNRGYKVRALIHLTARALDGLDIERVPGDILDEESLKRAFTGADIVFHLAARISIVNWDWRKVFTINVTGVQNVINACFSARIKRLIHTSSFHAHRQKPYNKPLDESSPLLGKGKYPPYNYSKALGEKIVSQAVEKGLDAVIINPAGMLGPYDFRPSYFGQTIISIAQGRLSALIDAGLSWADMRDVAEGMINAGEKAPPGAKYIFGGNWVKLADIARIAADITGVKPPGVVLPLWVAKLAAPFAAYSDRITGHPPRFTPVSIKELESNPNLSHARAKKELGYEPRPIEQTVTDTVSWFKSNGFLQ